jgi:uncharacterized protein (DUF3820 family)
MNPIDREDFRNLLQEISEMPMPFGKYGPEHHPPRGFPIHDLPIEYLTWFKERGFPKGRLGELMAWVWELKANGLDAVFDPFRQARGGRARLKPKRPSQWDFDD